MYIYLHIHIFTYIYMYIKGVYIYINITYTIESIDVNTTYIYIYICICTYIYIYKLSAPKWPYLLAMSGGAGTVACLGLAALPVVIPVEYVARMLPEGCLVAYSETIPAV